MTKAKITGTELKITEREPLLAGSVDLNKIEFSFSGEWSGLIKQIDFTNEQSGQSRRISAQMQVCTVPWELLRTEGDINCYIRGIGADGKLKMRTNEANLGTVLGSAQDDVPGSASPTPEVCDELAAKIGEPTELETEAKDNLVAAINEVKQAADGKQDKLIAGDNITIAADGKTISATGGGTSDVIGYFEVTLTEREDGLYTGSKTFAQVKAEIESNKRFMFIDGYDCVFIVTNVGEAIIEFAGMLDGTDGWMAVTLAADDRWEITPEVRISLDWYNNLADDIGRLTNLTTADKSNLVAAVNEVNQIVDTKADAAKLAVVAASGSYNDLTDKPTIPAPVTEQTVSAWGFTKNTGTYSKPTDGIPKADLANDVQDSLSKAETALQSVSTDDIVALAVTNAKIANGAVSTGKIAMRAVTEEKISTELLDKIDGMQPKTITDTAGYYTTDTVEGALAEIGGTLDGLEAAINTIRGIS